MCQAAIAAGDARQAGRSATPGLLLWKRRCTCQEARLHGTIVAKARYGQRQDAVAGSHAGNGRSATFDQGRGMWVLRGDKLSKSRRRVKQPCEELKSTHSPTNFVFMHA